MLTTQLRKVVLGCNYELYGNVVRVISCVGILVHLLLYFALHHGTGNLESFLTRMVVVALYLPLLFYPAKGWNWLHKLYFELALVVTMPAYFSYMLLTEVTLYWAVTYVFIVIFYAVFARWQFALWLHPLAVTCAFIFLYRQYPNQHMDLEQVVEIQVVALASLIVVQILKTFFEASRNVMLRLKEKADQQNEIFSALLDISVEVSRFDDLDEIFHLILKRFETIYPNRGFGLMVEGPRPKIIPYMAFRGVSQKDTSFLLQVHPYVLGFASVSMENDEETVASIEGDDWQVFGGGIKSTSMQGRTVYCFKLFVKGEPLNDDEKMTLELFLETIRGMTRTKIQALELEKYSNTDQLTGLYNRNYFDRVMEEWQAKARPEKPFSIVFGDINGLKRINDKYGHGAGDAMIISSAGLLTQAVRNSDLVFRLGGDELVILCPATNLEEAQELLRRLRLGAEALEVECTNEQTGELTDEDVHISFGLACSTEQGPEKVVELADNRMYEEKENWYDSGKGQRYR